MPKKTKPKKPVFTKTRIFVVVPVVIVSLVVLVVGVRAHRINQQRDAFVKADAVATATIEEINDLLGEPKYVDRASVCYLRAPEEFAREVLFCRTMFKSYYLVQAGKELEATSIGKRSVDKHYSVSLNKQVFMKDTGITKYSLGSNRLNTVGDLSCAFSVEFPVTKSWSNYLPNREFSEKNIMEVSADCDTQSITPYYKMVEG